VSGSGGFDGFTAEPYFFRYSSETARLVGIRDESWFEPQLLFTQAQHTFSSCNEVLRPVADEAAA
jgi:hypothetical protein